MALRQSPSEEVGDDRDQRRAARIRRLVEGKGLDVVFQPIVDLRSGGIVAVEALARMSGRPTRTPDWWIGEAWAVGLGVDLELAALRTALAHLERLPPEVLLTVNVSPRAFVSPGLLETMEGAPAGHVVVEITEEAPVEDYEIVEDGVRRLRARGVRLAIDDAGAGFSSLGSILRLAPEFIKLDISLIRTIANDDGGGTTASALIRFASDIGAEIIAEGIETPGHLQALRRLGVAFGQGFYLARPAASPLAYGRSVHLDPLPAGWGAIRTRGSHPGGIGTRLERIGRPLDRTVLADVVAALRKTARADPFGRAGNLRARIRELKAADHAVGRELDRLGVARHTVRYVGRPPWPDTLFRLADALERITTLTDVTEAAQALREFDTRLHGSIPSGARRAEPVASEG